MLNPTHDLNNIETAVKTSFQFSTRAAETLNQAIQAKSTRRVNFFEDPSTQTLRQCLSAFEDSFLNVSSNMMQQLNQDKKESSIQKALSK